MKTNAKLITVISLLCWSCASRSAFADNADNFNDNFKDASKWAADNVTANGVLNEINQRLQYTCASVGPENHSERPWNLTRFPYNADWEIQFDTYNATNPTIVGQVCSMGVTILSPLSGGDFLYHELYRVQHGGGAGIGVNADVTKDDISVAGADSGDLALNRVALLVSWDSKKKVMNCLYDKNPEDGFQWIKLASLGLSGAGGTSGNTDWGMDSKDQFFVSVYGYSSTIKVDAGEMYLDNFSERGGVTPDQIERPKPTGRFPLAFPKNNPLLTRILSMTGNYRGRIPGTKPRDFNLDVAQDESGKLSVMGTVDRIKDSKGDPELAGSVGEIRTVNGTPTLKLGGPFNGILDGKDAKVDVNATVPVAVVDIGGGTKGVMGTANAEGKIGKIPVTVDHFPLELETPPQMLKNLNSDWSLKLVLTSSSSGKSKRIFGSATLVLPNGDTIKFPAKAVKYSKKLGLSINYTKGTNTSTKPHTTDTKTKVVLSKLIFEKKNGKWQLQGGKIKYQFLGQKGNEDLIHFLKP
jgi:hypothetical protein